MYCTAVYQEACKWSSNNSDRKPKLFRSEYHLIFSYAAAGMQDKSIY
jgi:hypothetical protein